MISLLIISMQQCVKLNLKFCIKTIDWSDSERIGKCSMSVKEHEIVVSELFNTRVVILIRKQYEGRCQSHFYGACLVMIGTLS